MERRIKSAYLRTTFVLAIGVGVTVALASTAQSEAWFSDLDASDRWEKSQEHCFDDIRPAHRYKWVEKKILIRREQHLVHTRAATHGFEFDPYAVRPFRDPTKRRYRRGREPYNHSYLIKPVKRRVTYIPPVYDVIREKVPITAVGTYCQRLSKFERWVTTVKRVTYRIKDRLRGGRHEPRVPEHRAREHAGTYK